MSGICDAETCMWLAVLTWHAVQPGAVVCSLHTQLGRSTHTAGSCSAPLERTDSSKLPAAASAGTVQVTGECLNREVQGIILWAL